MTSRAFEGVMEILRAIGRWLDSVTVSALARPLAAAAWIIGLYVLIWTLAQALFFYTPRSDTVEIMALAPFWPLGMAKHPTLPVWLQEIAFLVTGRAHASTYALSMLLMGGTLALLWIHARRITTPQIALVAVALTLANYYFTAPVTQYNHNVPSLFFGAALVLAYREAILGGRIWSWIGVGLAAAALFLTKYSGAFLVIALAGHALCFAKGRARIATPGPWLAVAVFVAAIAPHLVWLYGAPASPVAYAFERQADNVTLLDRVWIGISFILSQIGFHAGFIVAIGLVALRLSRDAKPVVIENPRVSGFDLSLILVATLAPMLINAAINAVSAVHGRPEWGGAYFFFSALAVILLLPRRLTLRNPRGASFLLAILLFILPLAVTIAPSINRPTHPALYPARDVAAAVAREWREAAGEAPLRYLVGPGNMTTYAVALCLEPTPLVIHGPEPEAGLPFDAEALRGAGAVAIWPSGEQPILPLPVAGAQPVADIAPARPGLFRDGPPVSLTIYVVPPR